MSTKELIHTEVNNARDEDLDELYQLIQGFNAVRRQPGDKPGALARLKRIQINAPPDFAANLDLYASGEKSLATSPDAG